MFPVSYFRFEGLGPISSGFPGVHSIQTSSLWRFYRPMRLGDNIVGKGALWEQKLQPSEFAGKMLDQIGRNVCVDQKSGEVVAEEFNVNKRWEREAASERRESGKGTYSNWKQWIFTEEELQIIWEDFSRIEIRGATPRYWEDVQIGENLPSLVTMPYSSREVISFFMGYGGPFSMSNAVLFDYFQKHPGLNVPDPRTKTPDVPERTHYDAEFARTTGAPDMFDITYLRFCWATSLVTNWMGDDALLREISCVARRFNAYGDVTWINGQIVEKHRLGEENLVKIVLAWDNQRYRHSWGHAVVNLPSREQGSGVLLPPPPDPEGNPYIPMSEEVRNILYARDPELPFGSHFKRRE